MAKNKYLAAALSFFVGGLGQLYVGDLGKAVIFLILDFSSGYIYAYMNETVGAVLSLIVTVVSMVDAYKSAQRIRENKTEVRQPQEENPVVRVY